MNHKPKASCVLCLGVAGITLAAPVVYTPTFVVVDGGREIGRITGFINDEAFWGLLDTLAAKLERVPEPKI